MMRRPLLAAVVLILATIPLMADEADEKRAIKGERAQVVQQEDESEFKWQAAERRERAAMMKRQLKEMRESGASEEQLKEFQRHMRVLADDSRRPDSPENRKRELRERELRERESRHREHAHEHSVNDEGHHHDPHQHREPPREELGRRMHHLQVAADNLMAAGMRDLAAEVMRRAEALEREHHPEGGRRPHPEIVEGLERQIHHLHRQLEELRDHVHRLDRAMRHHHDDDEDEEHDD